MPFRSCHAVLSSLALSAAGIAPSQPLASFPAAFELANLETASGEIGFVVNGPSADFMSGAAVASAGDLNGDGIDDLVIGAPGATTGGTAAAGAAFVVFGRDTASGNAFPGAIELSLLDGSDGFALAGIDAAEECGLSVAPAGDINGDGLDDLAIGAPFASSGGRVYVVFGRDTATQSPFPATIDLAGLNGNNGFALTAIDTGDRAGFSVAGAGDVNNDGIDDLIVGASSAEADGMTLAGQAYVLFGRDTAAAGNFPASVGLGALNGVFGFTINGRSTSDNAGWSVSSAGDLNHDGVGDIAIGAPDAETDSQGFGTGQVYVVFGRDPALDGPFPGEIDPAALDGTDGFLIDGKMTADRAGSALALAGDINGDGIDDLAIGAPNGATGESYVVFGRDTASAGDFPASLALASLDGITGITLAGAAFGDESGTSIAGLGDLNNDGLDDLVIGASEADPSGTRSGESYVVFGRDVAAQGAFQPTIQLADLDGTDGFTPLGVDAGDRSGTAVAGAGDLNADGAADLVIGANRADPNGVSSGESYVIFGLTQTDEPCVVDVNQDGTVDGGDFFAWVAAFGNQGPGCDQNGDSLCNASDFFAWVANFSAGCG